MRRIYHHSVKTARRVVVAVVGTTVLAIGVALLVLPGPAMVVIPVGLAILGIEFAFARRWLRALREGADAVWRNGADVLKSVVGGGGGASAPPPPDAPSRRDVSPAPARTERPGPASEERAAP